GLRFFHICHRTLEVRHGYRAVIPIHDATHQQHTCGGSYPPRGKPALLFYRDKFALILLIELRRYLIPKAIGNLGAEVFELARQLLVKIVILISIHGSLLLFVLSVVSATPALSIIVIWMRFH